MCYKDFTAGCHFVKQQEVEVDDEKQLGTKNVQVKQERSDRQKESKSRISDSVEDNGKEPKYAKSD